LLWIPEIEKRGGRGARLAQSVAHLTLDLRVVDSSPILCVGIPYVCTYIHTYNLFKKRAEELLKILK